MNDLGMHKGHSQMQKFVDFDVLLAKTLKAKMLYVTFTKFYRGAVLRF